MVISSGAPIQGRSRGTALGAWLPPVPGRRFSCAERNQLPQLKQPRLRRINLPGEAGRRPTSRRYVHRTVALAVLRRWSGHPLDTITGVLGVLSTMAVAFRCPHVLERRLCRCESAGTRAQASRACFDGRVRNDPRQRTSRSLGARVS